MTINKTKVKNYALLGLLLTSLICFIFAGINTSKCRADAKAVNDITAEINEVMVSDPDFYIPGTPSYIKIEELTKQREQKNADHDSHDKGIVALSIVGAASIFTVLFVVINTAKSSRN